MQLWNWLGKYRFSIDIKNFLSHITYNSLMFFIAYTFKGWVNVFAGHVKIISHSPCRTSAILNYFCPLKTSYIEALKVLDNWVHNRLLKNNFAHMSDYQCVWAGKMQKAFNLCSEIVWHRFFAVPAFIRHLRSYIAARKFFLKTSPNYSSMFWACARFWQSHDILGKIKKLRSTPTD